MARLVTRLLVVWLVVLSLGEVRAEERSRVPRNARSVAQDVALAVGASLWSEWQAQAAVSARTAARRVSLSDARLEALTMTARRVSLVAQAVGVVSPPAVAGMWARPSYRPNDPKRPTVCLIHGMNSSSESFVHMVPLLEQAGYGVVLYDFPFNRDLDVSAPRFVQDWADFRRKQNDKQPWSIVTHSMGALLARFYLEGESFLSDVESLIMVGPPNAGAAIARVQVLVQWIESLQAAQRGGRPGMGAHVGEGLGEAATDLIPGSRFLRELNRRGRREGVRYYVLAGDLGFLTAETRTQIEARLAAMAKEGGILGGFTRLVAGDVRAPLAELTDGTGDGVVSVASTQLQGVLEHRVIPANHVELIRGPLLYPDPGPVACMPHVMGWLKGRSAEAGR